MRKGLNTVNLEYKQILAYRQFLNYLQISKLTDLIILVSILLKKDLKDYDEKNRELIDHIKGND